MRYFRPTTATLGIATQRPGRLRVGVERSRLPVLAIRPLSFSITACTPGAGAVQLLAIPGSRCARGPQSLKVSRLAGRGYDVKIPWVCCAILICLRGRRSVSPGPPSALLCIATTKTYSPRALTS